MGEVGTNTQDNPDISIKMNGINGGCAEDDPTDADSQDDSQASSEVSSTKKSTDNSAILAAPKLIAADESLKGNGKTDDGTADGKEDEEEDGIADDGNEDDEEDDEEAITAAPATSKIEAVNTEDDVDSMKPTLATVPEESQEAKDDDDDEDDDEEMASSHSSEQIESKKPPQENGDKVKDDDAVESKTDEDDTQDSEDRPAPVEEVDEDVTQDSTAPSEEKNPLDGDDDDDDDDGDEPMVIDDSALNGDSNAASSSVDENEVQHVPIVQEVHAISDSDDDDAGKRIPKPTVEHMEIDGLEKSSPAKKENGHSTVTDLKTDDDKPVSIASDSDTETPVRPPASTPKKNGSSAIVIESKVLSDNEDCVVIEDDNSKKPEDDLLSPRRSARSRKSVVKVRDFSAFDDDIEEIVEDPLSQPAAKKPKISNTPPALGFTIQDARSLATDPLSSSASFQQQFIQSSHETANATTTRKKEPTLVIIDTNQIMARGGAAATVQALQNQNFSVHPVGTHPTSQSSYNNNSNMRASITPILQKSPQSNIASATAKSPIAPAASILLPALTDDMFVLEAPSFIVPYIYEKPPRDNLKDIIEKIGKELAEQRAKEDLEDAANEAKELEAMTDEEKAAVLAEQIKKSDESKKKKAKKQANKSGDESWDESDTSTDDEASDTEQRTKVLIKSVDEDLESIKTHIITPDTAKDPLASASSVPAAKRDNYFESPLGKFFMDIGINLVQEHVQTDLLRQQKRKLVREGDAATSSVQMAINSLKKNLEHSKVKNEIFKFETKRCEYCNFKSESSLSMANHYEAPHQVGAMYKCNFCSFESRPPYDILFHMEAIHNVKARLEKTISYHQCPNCPFEDNGKSKLARHALVCVKKFRPEVNLNPPLDWEPPAKIPRIKPRHGLVGTATAYQAMAAQAQRAASGAAMQQRQNAVNAAMMRGRGRPQTVTKTSPVGTVLRGNHHTAPARPPPLPSNMMPTNFQIGAGQFIQVTGAGLALLPNARNSTYITQVQSPGPKSSKSQQPSISITPLPRQPSNNAAAMQAAAAASSKPLNASGIKPGQTPTGGSKASFVICEICDGYIKDLDQLRNHMQWMHKVKIHPKMIYNRPPLNCQKCQFRFFTDQGLERHLLGSHGLVTSSMQEAANKGKDAGRCPVCGRMYQWKLLNHVSRDHNMTLKPAHLSYKCTVCTATFGMYKQFENHVYSAHSTVAKKSMDGKSKPTPSGSKAGPSSNDSLLKPLKINDEITIIPQPAQRHSRGGGGGGGGGGSSSNADIIEIL